jgi:hypothetical protein
MHTGVKVGAPSFGYGLSAHEKGVDLSYNHPAREVSMRRSVLGAIINPGQEHSPTSYTTFVGTRYASATLARIRFLDHPS